eukprot:1723059-Amphidinium_carterae.1
MGALAQQLLPRREPRAPREPISEFPPNAKVGIPKVTTSPHTHTHTHTHAHTHTRAQAHAHARAHTHARAPPKSAVNAPKACEARNPNNFNSVKQ